MEEEYAAVSILIRSGDKEIDKDTTRTLQVSKLSHFILHQQDFEAHFILTSLRLLARQEYEYIKLVFSTIKGGLRGNIYNYNNLRIA